MLEDYAHLIQTSSFTIWSSSRYPWVQPPGSCGDFLWTFCAAQLIAVHSSFFCSNPISWSRNPVFRKSLKLLGTCASFCLNSTVNSTLLSSFGVQWRSICGNTVIIHLKHSRQTFQKHLSLFNSVPYGNGSTGWFSGWRHTGMGRVQRMHSLM